LFENVEEVYLATQLHSQTEKKKKEFGSMTYHFDEVRLGLTRFL
jgi:hypothetical protein